MVHIQKIQIAVMSDHRQLHFPDLFEEQRKAKDSLFVFLEYFVAFSLRDLFDDESVFLFGEGEGHSLLFDVFVKS
jgi:hypothetical protein